MADDIDRQPLLDTQQNRLLSLLDFSASIDAKVLALLAGDIALLIFIGQAQLNLIWWQSAILLGPYFASLVYVVLAALPRQYVAASIDLDDHPEYLAMDKETLVLQLLADTERAIKINTKLNDLRWSHCKQSFVYALVGSLVLLLTLGLQ